MPWKVVGDITVVIHAVWIAAALFGPFFAVRRPRLRAIHLAVILVPLVFVALGMYCPLTYLETWSRFRQSLIGQSFAEGGGQSPAVAYPGGFIVKHLERWIYWDVPIQVLAAANLAWLALWTTVYARLWRKEKK